MAAKKVVLSKLEGTEIPDFKAAAVKQGDEFEFKLSDYSGKKLIVFFYPKDNTSGCSAEAVSLEANSAELEKRGFTIVGVSGDSIKSHKNFAEKKGLSFALISDDENKTVHNLFETWQLKKMCGKEYMGTVRTTFLLDENATVVKEFKKVTTKMHGEEILEFLDTV